MTALQAVAPTQRTGSPAPSVPAAESPEALELLLKAAVLDPADAEPLYIAGLIYLDLRKPAEAAVQCHGGMGFTWEQGVHVFYRAALAGRGESGGAGARAVVRAHLVDLAGAR